jgi:hypothetical protein
MQKRELKKNWNPETDIVRIIYLAPMYIKQISMQ